jgi:hypothetical protein
MYLLIFMDQSIHWSLLKIKLKKKIIEKIIILHSKEKIKRLFCGLKGSEVTISFFFWVSIINLNL